MTTEKSDSTLLALGAVVAAVGGGSAHDERAPNSLSSKAMPSSSGLASTSGRYGAGGGGAVPTTIPYTAGDAAAIPASVRRLVITSA